jgi:hypothetical protein
MADLNKIVSAISDSFRRASHPPPVMTVPIKPDVVPEIISGLGRLKGRTEETDIVQSGSVYSFIDKRTNQALVEVNTKENVLTLYKSPKELAERIDSAFISADTITKFINDSRSYPAQGVMQPSPNSSNANQPTKKPDASSPGF